MFGTGSLFVISGICYKRENVCTKGIIWDQVIILYLLLNRVFGTIVIAITKFLFNNKCFDVIRCTFIVFSGISQ